MCSIPVDADSNEVLPCGGGASSHAPPFVPRCSKDTSVSPLGMQRLLESVPESIRGCKGFGGGSGGSGGSNLRVVIPPPMGKVYDLTQCDFQLVGMTAVFVRQENKIYLTHGLEIGGWVYALVGILVVVLVGCITQNIVHIIDPEGSRPSISWIGVAAAFASLMVVVSSMESLSRSMLVTHEDVVAYWYMVCYCIVRILVSADVEIPLAYQNIKGWFRKKRKVHPDDNGTSETKPLLGESSMAKEGDDKQSDDDFRNNHNLLATSLQLLSTRWVSDTRCSISDTQCSISDTHYSVDRMTIPHTHTHRTGYT